jgi:hypothetical protein
MIVYDEDGLEAIDYHCPHCNKLSAAFLVAHVEEGQETYLPGAESSQHFSLSGVADDPGLAKPVQ